MAVDFMMSVRNVRQDEHGLMVESFRPSDHVIVNGVDTGPSKQATYGARTTNAAVKEACARQRITASGDGCAGGL